MNNMIFSILAWYCRCFRCWSELVAVRVGGSGWRLEGLVGVGFFCVGAISRRSSVWRLGDAGDVRVCWRER